MVFRSRHPDDDPDLRRSRARSGGDRSLASRVAWVVLGAGALVVAARASVATFVQVHGEGMDPTILDGDRVVLLRSRRFIQSGDVIVYNPSPQSTSTDGEREGKSTNDGGDGQDSEKKVDPDKDPNRRLRNTAVVDVDEIDKRWKGLSKNTHSQKQPPKSFRVGRVIAVPGDRLTFNDPEAALGLVVNGEALRQGVSSQNKEISHEWLGDQRYTIRQPLKPIGWPGLDLLRSKGPIEVRADGYLVLADNREDGACCDSRALGWVFPEQISGEVVLRYRTMDEEQKAEGAKEWHWLP